MFQLKLLVGAMAGMIGLAAVGTPAIVGTHAGCLAKGPRRRRWVSVILTLVLLVSGVIVGAGSALLFVRHRALMRIRQPSEAVAMDTGRIQKSLGLTDQQARKVETIRKTWLPRANPPPP